MIVLENAPINHFGHALYYTTVAGSDKMFLRERYVLGTASCVKRQLEMDINDN